MATIEAIPDQAWLIEHIKPNLVNFLRENKRLVNRLPLTNITPQRLVGITHVSPEFMVICLMSGAWLRSGDWRLYVRSAIANRIRVRKSRIFTERFDDIVDEFMEFQAEGGNFAIQKRLKNVASRMVQHPNSTKQETAAAKLILSTLDGIELNTLLQPFHWIRLAVGFSDDVPQFGVALTMSEYIKQKKAICKMLER